MSKSHTLSLYALVRWGLVLLFSLVTLLAAFSAWQAGPALTRISAEEEVKAGRRPAYYAALGQMALEAGNYPKALKAARAETVVDALNFSAWQRRAGAATAFAGQPNKEALEALLIAYELAPFTSPTDMAWRVEYASTYEASMPDVLIDLTISQIEVLEEVPETFQMRWDWCKTFPDGALARAACATTPTAWRYQEERSGN